MDRVGLGCCLLAFGLYYNTLDAGFVYDDRRAILTNPDLQPTAPWRHLIEHDFWGTPLTDSGSHGSYRPLCVLTFRFNHIIGGLRPFGYHLVNVLLHCLATVLLVKLARIVLPRSRSDMGPLITGALFATHPIHTEAVAGIVGRADLSSANLCLLALLAYTRHVKTRDLYPKTEKKNTGSGGWGYLGISVSLGAAAMLCKETGVTVLGVCAVYDLVYCKGNKKNQYRSIALLTLSALLLLTLRLRLPAPSFSSADNPSARDPRLLARLLTFLYLPAFNFLLLLSPSTLSFDWGMDAVPAVAALSDARNLVTLAFYVGLGAAAGRCRPRSCRCCRVGAAHSARCRVANNNNEEDGRCRCRRGTRAALFGAALLALPFLPATNLLVYVGFVVAERVLYLPSAGLCLVAGCGGAALYRRYRWAFTVGFVALLVTFSAKTVMRNRDWNNEEALYRAAVSVNPPKAFGNLGSVLSSQGRSDEAEWAFRKALQHRPNMADVHYNLGILLQASQRLEEAIESYQRAIHFRPSLALAYVNLGAALISAGRCQEAVSILRQGSKLDGAGVKDRREHEKAKISALLQLGALYSEQGRLHRALAAYREAAASLPDHYPPQSVFNVLGETLARLHQDEEAERWYQAALNAQPDHVPAHITYGKLLAKNVSRAAEAEQWFRKAQRLAPQDPSVYHHYGEFLASRRRHKEAAVMYERAAELRPRDYELAVAAATATRQAGRHLEAERWYRTAVELKPSDARSHTNLGAILHLNGKYTEAAMSYREALKLQPGDVTTLTNLHKLHSVMT